MKTLVLAGVAVSSGAIAVGLLRGGSEGMKLREAATLPALVFISSALLIGK